MGKKYIEPFVSNPKEWTLEFILDKICIEHDDSFLDALIHDQEVHKRINMITNRYGFASKGGFLISMDVIRGIVITELMWATWHDYDINRVDVDGTIKDSYLAFVCKIVPLRVKTQINLERPSRLIIKKKNKKCHKSIIENYYDKKFEKEYGIWKNDNYDDYGNKILMSGEILVGGINDLEMISDEIEESRWNNTYGNNFIDIESDYRFEDILENAGLTDNQSNVITKIYKDGFTQKQVGELLGGVKQPSINDSKKAALKKLRKKFKNI